jgi:NADPH-dependent 2,4-dienoyl-CoA reductase/sulfur reductase-like enzyme/rhodanese-related sulfurtransferase
MVRDGSLGSTPLGGGAGELSEESVLGGLRWRSVGRRLRARPAEHALGYLYGHIHGLWEEQQVRIVIVGGVAAGMSTAARARRLDESAEIVVLERDAFVSFANCGLPYHIGEVIEDRDRLLLQTPASLKASLDLDVRTGTEVVAIDPEARTVRTREVASGAEQELGYDRLVLCPGAVPVTPPLPGIDDPRVHVLRRMEDMDAIKARVDAVGTDGLPEVAHAVVIGGGYIGLEMAENLRHRGREVTLVELADQLMPPLDRELTSAMEAHLRTNGVTLHLGVGASGFAPTDDGRLAVTVTDGTLLPTDLVLLAAGVRPNTALAEAAGVALGPRGGIAVDEHLRTNLPDVYAAGDAVEVRHSVLPGSWLIPLAGPANRQGRVVADNLCGRDTTFGTVQGTGIVKVFDLVAGGVGANQRQLEAAGIPYERVHLHPSGHAGYYPGTAAMHLKVLFAPDTGRLLGAGIVGYDGVDKRLDVLATALSAGMTVYDLETLELAYAPPFGSAKDPVNMAGFIGANLLRGDIALWYAEGFAEDTDGARLLDVRGPGEFATGHLPGAENVPLDALRGALGDWDRAQPFRLYCAVGFRSYLAYRILVQNGFRDVRTLAGGMHSYLAATELQADREVVPREPVVSYAEERTGGIAGSAS